MADDTFVPSFESIELDSVSPSFAAAEYTVPKSEDSQARMGTISLGSVPMGDAEAPYGYNADGSVRKRRGRPPGSKNQTSSTRLVSTRDGKEVTKRLEGMMLAATGVVSVIRPHFQMTEDEAKNIADPLSAYLVRQEAVSQHVKEFLDRYDLFAAGLAFLAYLVRVYKDDLEYRRNRPADVVEAVSNRRTSRRRDESADATPRQNEEVGQSSDASRGELHAVDGNDAWFPTPYIAGD